MTGKVTLDARDALVKPDLSRTVVYLAEHPALRPSKPANQPPPISDRPQIAQKNKAFVPRFLIITKGTFVEFPNWDPFSHNVFSRSEAAPPFDLDRYAQGKSKTYQFTEVGVVQLFCNIHPQMRATILVTPNRYAARVDSDGRFQLRDVPAGDYELVAWHARCGKARQRVRINADAMTTTELTIKREPDRWLRERQHREEEDDYGGVTRGLGVKRDELELPVVEGAHPAAGAPADAAPDVEAEPDEATH